MQIPAWQSIPFKLSPASQFIPHPWIHLPFAGIVQTMCATLWLLSWTHERISGSRHVKRHGHLPQMWLELKENSFLCSVLRTLESQRASHTVKPEPASFLFKVAAAKMDVRADVTFLHLWERWKHQKTLTMTHVLYLYYKWNLWFQILQAPPTAQTGGVNVCMAVCLSL